MRYLTSKADAAEDASIESMEVVRFGDVLFHSVDDSEWASLAAPVRARLTQVPVDHLHLVVQKGRLFQREYPEVPVLLDKGRYLIVDLAAVDVTRLERQHEPCFAVRPLPPGGVVYAVRKVAPRTSKLAWVQGLVDAIDMAAFKATLTELVAFPTRESTSTPFSEAAKSMRACLDDLGFTTAFQSIDVRGKPSINLIAERQGNGPEPRLVFVACAHLDSVNHEDANGAAPGADDNGSGSAGVLTIARALRGFTPRNDLRLILWGGEEQGLFGSQQYVKSLSHQERNRIGAVINMDMIAVANTPKPAVLLEGADLSQSLIDALADAAALYTDLEVQTSLHPFNSDHVPFIDMGIPAVLTIEGNDSSNDEVHTARDTLATISFDLAERILRMNVACIGRLLDKA